ncbi:ATP-dependent helicase [Jeotgalibacillus sp. ET6]|uniref:UvrD-helicase domain-containing protein n=1 Tax=Jeotgalibacillus sp. ET6 TaxID=3037260 RepID=UPI00241846DA|nr:ATP-dependent helicase [Jeotgalibacillus sp. ET6]MDG5473623.1 ATP-dependent helicase [Jeotgalibacillus sp. ET6]
MKNKVSEQDWKPSDNIGLEDDALASIKEPNNVSIVAGPGAGKTELLAHKVGYLIETGVCKYPKKILAISFKVDAAKNLQDRVEKRYGKDVSNRFESKTFDSFAKVLLDQFHHALSEEYKPAKQYEIINNERLIDDIIKGYITDTNVYYPSWQQEYNLSRVNKLLKETRLPLSTFDNDLYDWINKRLWNVLLKGKNNLNSSLTFHMISILVEYLLRDNPLIVKSLHATYSHVFLDEFQDTTYIQYDLLKTAFLDSQSTVTTVGDNKQRIMGWAGALTNAFEIFNKDFNATQFSLLNNYRAAPRLIYIQNLFSKTLNNASVEAIPAGESSAVDGVCEIWTFQNHKNEANILAGKIKEWMDSEYLMPRDFCIIVKQQEHVYAAEITQALSKLNIESRIEKEFQDLLADELIILSLNFLKLCGEEKFPDLWLEFTDTVIKIKYTRSDLEDINILNVEKDLSKTLKTITDTFSNVNEANFETEFQKILNMIVEFLGEENIKAIYPKYNQKNYIEDRIERMINNLNYYEGASLMDLIQEFYGEYSIPIMTIHKSKGLEYSTVIFVGLEDAAFWSFKTQKESDKNAFFVALSRAKQRVIFTTSKEREILKYGKLTYVTQDVKEISEVLKILVDAKVPIVKEIDHTIDK